MFERNAAGTWVFKQQLGVTSTVVWPRVAIGGNAAVYDIGELRVVERGGQNWVAVQGPTFPYTRSWQSQIEYSGGRFYGSPVSCELMIVGKQSGAWSYQGNVAFARQPYCDNNDQWHSIDGDRALVMTENQARMYRRDSSGVWTAGEFLRRPDGNIAGGLNLSMSGSTATVEDDVYRAITPDSWQFVRHLQPLTAFLGRARGTPRSAVSTSCSGSGATRPAKTPSPSMCFVLRISSMWPLFAPVMVAPCPAHSPSMADTW